MKNHSRFSSLTALALALAILTAPLSALPRDRNRDRDRDRDQPPVIRIIKKISKVLGISTDDDLPGPPKP